MNTQPQSMAEAIRHIDKLNMLNGAILKAITERGSLTVDEYNVVYALALQEWREKHNQT